MNAYQDRLFKQLEVALEDYDPVTAVVQYDYANRGTLILMDGLFTIESWTFDVQHDRVTILQRGSTLGPRSDTVFWWTIGDPASNDEAARFLATWSRHAAEHVMSTAT